MTAPDAVHVAALAVTLHLPAVLSLKEKRRILKSIKDRAAGRFNVSVSEIGEHDKWQSAVLGFAMISNDKKMISSAFEKILSLIGTIDGALITNREIQFL